MSKMQGKYKNKLWNLLLVPSLVSATWYFGHFISDFIKPEWGHIAIAAICGFSGSFFAVKLWRK